MPHYMDIKITLKNYRCFQDTKPVSFVLRSGFTSFVGVNNAGKSSLLKFFYELRPLFKILAQPTGNLSQAASNSSQGLGQSPSIKDTQEIFCNLNERDLKLEVEFLEHQPRNATSEPFTPTK